MLFFYSATTKGFYLSELKDDYVSAGTWPADAIEISERWYNHLIEGQGKGKVITVNEYGQPVLSDQPRPTKDELILVAEAQKHNFFGEATAAISPLQDAVDLGIATDTEIKQLKALKEYRVALNRLDTSSAPDINWPARPE